MNEDEDVRHRAKELEGSEHIVWFSHSNFHSNFKGPGQFDFATRAAQISGELSGRDFKSIEVVEAE